MSKQRRFNPIIIINTNYSIKFDFSFATNREKNFPQLKNSVAYFLASIAYNNVKDSPVMNHKKLLDITRTFLF